MENLDTHKKFAVYIYYATHSTVERNNRKRCDYLKLENNLVTSIYDKHVNLSVLGVSAVGTYFIDNQHFIYEDNYHLFLCALDEDMFDIDIYSRPNRLP